jgi:hypothetical protein
MIRSPDFIVIGAMKSATTTLHDQLAAQPGFFMSTNKEPNFFSNDENYARGLPWYQSLFDDADATDLCGESSTHYTKLPTYPDTVQRMKAALPQLKLIYMMRHPINRLVSHYLHEQFEWRMQVPIDKAVEQYPELIAYGKYSMQLEPFLDAYGPENILLIFFERFVRQGVGELARIYRFLGCPSQPTWKHTSEATNVSSERMRESPIRDAIVNAPVLRTIRRRFIPKPWRERAKRLWQIKDRPELSEFSIRRLAEIFDADLVRLGHLLNLELSCRRFDEVARECVPTWSRTYQTSVR